MIPEGPKFHSKEIQLILYIRSFSAQIETYRRLREYVASLFKKQTHMMRVGSWGVGGKGKHGPGSHRLKKEVGNRVKSHKWVERLK